MSKFEINELTKISRDPHRGSYDKETVYAILDEAIDITISYIEKGVPKALPTGFVRVGDNLYIHGSVKSHFVKQICQNAKVCLSVSLLDGLVLANTAFNHSFNYRSVVVFSSPYEVQDDELKNEVLKAFTEKLLPGRWDDDIRKPTPEELKITSLVCFPIEDASAKMRIGQPNNVKQDAHRAVWTGYVPSKRVYDAPIVSPDVDETIKIPEYMDYLYSEALQK